MHGDTGAEVRPDLVERLEELARETGAMPDEIESAARFYADRERRREARIQAALAEDAGVRDSLLPLDDDLVCWLESHDDPDGRVDPGETPSPPTPADR